MASNAVSRAAVRAELTAKLAAGLVGSGKPAAAVYGYRVFDFAGLSPVVVVTPAGTTRIQTTMNTTSRDVEMVFDVFCFVLASDAAAGVSESATEDAIDALEKAIADIVQDNVTNHSPSIAGGAWNTLQTAGPCRDDSIIDAAIGNVGGAVYKRLVVPLRVTCLDG